MTYYLEKSIWYRQELIPEGMNLQMLNDSHRLDKLLGPAIADESAGKVVVDLGCGTGLLGLTALQHGASFVYFVERDPQMFHILESTLPKLVESNKYMLINSDIESLTVDNFKGPAPELIVSEFYGPTLFDEGYIFYVRHLKSLFQNLKFIPQCFDVEVNICDVNYRTPIWPKNKMLLEHFRFMYSEKGFNSNSAADNYIPTVNPRLQGKLTYDTETDRFDNFVILQTIKGQEQLIHCVCVVRHGEYEHRYSSYGWYVPKHSKTYKYEVSVSLEDEESMLQPRFKKIK
jgi:predicted RNA methylase